MIEKPTIIIVHRKEPTHKCTVLPLKRHPGLEFFRFPMVQAPPLDGYVRIGIGGAHLGPQDDSKGLLLLDSSWRRVGEMERFFEDVPVRSLPPWETAYPRTSQVKKDPDGGLATVEALFAALTQLGRDTDGILKHYHWKDKFLRINAERICQ